MIPPGFAPLQGISPYLDLVGPLQGMQKPDGTRVLGLLMEDRHTNTAGIAHGGLLTTLADVALSFAAFESYDPPRPVLTLSLTMDFAGPARPGDWLEAHADLQHGGGSIAFANCYLLVGERRIVRASAVMKVLAGVRS